MANTYDATTLQDDTAEGRRNRVRFELDDTSTTAGEFEFDDEEVDYLLSGNGDVVLLAAAAGARRLAMSWARKADVSVVGPLKVEYRERAQQFSAMAEQFIVRAQHEGDGLAPTPWAGGIRRNTDDDGLVQPRFYRGQFVNDEGSRSDDDDTRRDFGSGSSD